MPENHPDELELLAYVEEQADADLRREVAEHLVACRACSDQVRRLETARDALRAAPLLELPEARRDAMLAALPARREPWRPFASLRRTLAVAAPVAAAAALIAVFVAVGTQGGGGDGDEGAAVAEETHAAQDEAAGGQEAAPQGELIRRVAGPAGEVVRLLQAKGIVAVVADGRVVAEGDADEVREALRGRPSGGVSVYVR